MRRPFKPYTMDNDIWLIKEDKLIIGINDLVNKLHISTIDLSYRTGIDEKKLVMILAGKHELSVQDLLRLMSEVPGIDKILRQV